MKSKISNQIDNRHQIPKSMQFLRRVFALIEYQVTNFDGRSNFEYLTLLYNSEILLL